MTLIEKLPKRLETTYPICGTVRACYSIVQRRNLFSLVSRETIFFFLLFSFRSFPFTHYFPFNYFAFLSLFLSLDTLPRVFPLANENALFFFLSFFLFFEGAKKGSLGGEKKRAERRKYFSSIRHNRGTVEQKKKKKRRKKERKRALLSRRYSINSNDAQAHLITQ